MLLKEAFTRRVAFGRDYVDVLSSSEAVGNALAFNQDRPTIAIDFDGTIVEPNDNAGLDQVQLRSGAKRELLNLEEAGCRIIVWTSRPNYKDVGDWLREQGEPH